MKTLSLAAALIALTGCSGLSVTRLQSDAQYKEGIRFFRPHPYLLVVPSRDGLQASVVYLPDPDQEYVLNVRSGLGDVEAQATLADGWNLTALGDSRHGATADVLTGLGRLGAGVAGLETVAPSIPPEGSGGLAPGLYRIDIDRTKGMKLVPVPIAAEGSR